MSAGPALEKNTVDCNVPFSRWRKILWRVLVSVLILPGVGSGAMALEIATGKMLGPGYQARYFYVREAGGSWQPTYSEPFYRPEAAGRLMNLRVAQGIFHDEWLTEFPFDPLENTRRLIEALDTYKEHGILCINVSLQGGNAYQRSPIRRSRDFKDGPGAGSHVSAFLPDGSLKPEWLERLRLLVKELEGRGMFLNLMYFYQGQDEVLENEEAIDRAVIQATDWLIDNDCRNVLIEIANEHDVSAYDHERYIHRRMDHLIQLARSRFIDRQAPFRLPISASTGGSMAVYEGVHHHGDLVILHGNRRTPQEKGSRVRELVADASLPGPIYMNEDDNGRETTPEHLAVELASFDAVYEAGGSWGYMPWVQVQMFPFRHFLPSASTEVEREEDPERRDPAYFHAVLEHIRSRLFRLEVAARPCRLVRLADTAP